MKFIKLGILLLLLNACSMTTQQAQLPAEDDATTVLTETDAVTNPYLLQQTPVPDEADKQFKQALEQIADEQWLDAEMILQQLVQQYPTLSGPYVNLGLIAWQRDDVVQAEQYFTQAIAVNSNNDKAYIQLGILLRDSGRFAEAEAVYLQALSVWPENTTAMLNLAILYDLYLGDLQQARRYYQQFQQYQSSPDNTVKLWLADIEQRIGPVAAAEGE